jgi:hypothetical protein
MGVYLTKETTGNYRELEANGEVYLSYATSQSPIRTSTALATTVSVPTCAAWGTNAVVYLWAHCCKCGNLSTYQSLGSTHSERSAEVYAKNRHRPRLWPFGGAMTIPRLPPGISHRRR